MNYSSLSQVRTDLDNGTLLLPDLVNHYLQNISSKASLNIFLSVYSDEALKNAEEIQKKLLENKAGSLAGLVIAIKDVLCYRDHPLQCGSKILDGFESQFTATAIQRLIDEDAIIIGRLNCDEFAMGSSNENSAFGPVLNPLDETKVPGGSSGGSAAAVAADTCLAALGTDTGGSVRQPAAFCGVVGLKPTYSRISRYGLASYASSFDTIGVLSKSIEDAAVLLETMAGHDDMDSTSSTKAVPVTDLKNSYNHGETKVGVINQSFIEGTDPAIQSLVNEVSQQLEGKLEQVEQVDFQELPYALPTYYILTTAEASTNLSRYDGVRYGFRSEEHGDLTDMYVNSRSQGFGEEVRRRILLGTFVLSASYYDAYYTKAQKVRKIIRDKMRAYLQEYDFLILPATPTPAFELGSHSTSLEMYLADLFTVPASVAGFPAISLPVKHNSCDLPLGLQVIGREFQEDKLLRFSKYLYDDAIITA